jgi:Leucine-rich repeat (LRR) protein
MNDGVDQQRRRGGEEKNRLLSLLVKRNKDRYEFDVDWDSSTVEDVFTVLSEKSNALKRTMKLIVGGQTMTASDDGKKIFSEVVAKKIKGDKVTCMLLDGSNATTTTTTKTVSAGAAMASSMAEKRRREAMEKMMERKSKVTAEKSSTTILSEKRSGGFGAVWEKTGICSSQNSGLDALPIAALEALNADAKIKVFDFSSNAIARVPSVVFTLPALRNITRISLCNNNIESAGFDFKMLFANFKFLKYLDLSNNNLSGAIEITSNSSAAEEEGEEENEEVNEEVKTRSPLQLKISNNKITSFSSSFFKALPPLQSFDASGNQICDSIAHYFVGSETTLTHINLANNARVSAIPNEFRNMKSLQSLILDGNRIDKKGIPAVVLRDCERLSELSLKQNQVTIEELRELDGWDVYNERRVSRADKILDAKTMLGDASFREGADAERYTRDF